MREREDASRDAGERVEIESTSATSGWKIMRGMSARELRLAHTMPTGQSFRWQSRPDGDYVGVIGRRVVRVREDGGGGDARYRVYCRPRGETDADDEREILGYFNAGVSLSEMYAEFGGRDERFRSLATHVDGARMLRQDPSECLFSFICSSNNHISRIHGMVEKMCKRYGDALPVTAADVARDDEEDTKTEASALVERAEEESKAAFYAFPSASRLASEATEEELRALGFGYRAKFIVGTAKALTDAARELGDGASPESYLRALREDTNYVDAHAALQKLPGIGPKVSSCVCLFSLDKHAAIPVDTHVWRLACEHYAPELREAKTVTPKIMRAVELRFEEIFGAYAGWAHNALFIAELRSVRERLPESLRTPRTPKSKQSSGAAKRERPTPEPPADASLESYDDEDAFASPKRSPV